MFGVFFVVFADYFHDFVGFFLVVDLLECDGVLPSLGLGVYLENLDVDLYAELPELGDYLGLLLLYFRGDGRLFSPRVC
jgi:hypothetical protein